MSRSTIPALFIFASALGPVCGDEDLTWLESKFAAADYVAPGCRVLTFPDQGVGKLYLSERTAADGPWQIKKDRSGVYLAEALSECFVGTARGHVVVPDHPLFLSLEHHLEDLDFLQAFPPGTFVAIDGHSVQSTTENLSVLLQSGAEQIHFPGVSRNLKAQIANLPICDSLRFAALRGGANLISRCPNTVSAIVANPMSLSLQWEGHPSLQRIELPYMVSDQYAAQYGDDSLRILSTMPKLKEVSLGFADGPLTQKRIEQLRKLKVESLNLEFSGKAGLDREGILGLSKLTNLRKLTFSTLGEDAYPALKELNVKSLSKSSGGVRIRDAGIVQYLADMPSLKEFPHLNVPPTALEPLTHRSDIAVFSYEAPFKKTLESNTVHVEQIIRGNEGLRQLHLKDIQITPGIRSAIKSCRELRSLSLDRVQHTGEGSLEGQFPFLTKLAIWASIENPVTLQCPAVTDVSITGRELDWRKIPLFDNCPKLERLSLSTAGPFDSQLIERLAGYPELRELSSPRLKIEPKDVPLLCTLKGLVRLSVEGDLQPLDVLRFREKGYWHNLYIRSSRIGQGEYAELRRIFNGHVVVRPRR